MWVKSSSRRCRQHDKINFGITLEFYSFTGNTDSPEEERRGVVHGCQVQHSLDEFLPPGKALEGQSCKLQDDSQQNERSLWLSHVVFALSFPILPPVVKESWIETVLMKSAPPTLLFCFNRLALSWALYVAVHKHFCFYKQLPVNVAYTRCPLG